MRYRYYYDGSLPPEITAIYRTCNGTDWEMFDKASKKWTACDRFWWADAGDNVTELTETEVSEITSFSN